MKRNTCLAILLIVMIAILVWLLKKPVLPIPTKEQALTTHTIAPVKSERIGTAVQTNSLNVSEPTNGFQKELARAELDKQNRIQTAMQWRTPLLYFGKVIVRVTSEAGRNVASFFKLFYLCRNPSLAAIGFGSCSLYAAKYLIGVPLCGANSHFFNHPMI